MRIIILIIVVIAVCSCNSSNTNNPESVYIPFDKGNRWSYKYDPELNPKNSSFAIKNMSGRKTAEFDQFPCLGFFDNAAIVVMSDNGSYILDYPEAQDFEFIPPADKVKDGYQWTSGEWICNIRGINEVLTINGKTYNDCLHIEFSSSITFWGEMWIKKGVGIVKWAFNRTNPPTTELGYYELDEYIVK